MRQAEALRVTGRIRIAHVVHRFDCGGLQNGMVNIINRLPAEEFDHTIISLTDSTEFRSRLTEDIPLVELHKRPGNSPAYLYRVWKMLRGARFDVLHTRNLPCLEAQLAGLLAGVPARVHGEHGWDVFDLQGTKRRYRWLRRAFRLVVCRYVVVSRHLQDYLTATIGVHPQRIARIPNGVDAQKFQPLVGGPRADPFVIGSVGRIETVKDYMTLARALALIAREWPVCPQLVLVGEGSERNAIVAYLQAQGLARFCELTGARDDVPDLMRRFSVFVLPSRAEGMSNTILEAMASGLPVIATAVGGNGELVVDGETGFLVPPGDPGAIAARLTYYREHPEVLGRHGRAARERVLREFSLDVMAEGYRRLYHECAGLAGVRQAVA
jgi:sugar transferase (PEP-CTERM/EpsH1 system associated)